MDRPNYTCVDAPRRMSSNRDFIGLILIVGLYFLAFRTPLRVPFGLVLLLFMPGYVWSVAFFPQRTAITSIERLGIALGTSIALVPLIGVALHYLEFGFGFRPILITELAVIFTGMAIGVWQRQRSGAEAYRLQLGGSYPLIVVGLIVTLAVVGSVLSVGRIEPYTEFYIAEVSELPRTASVAQELAVDLTITNQEAAAHSYHYELWVEDNWRDVSEQLQRSAPFELAPNESKMESVIWQMPSIGNDQQIHFYLFKDNEAEPYRQLTLWIDVNE